MTKQPRERRMAYALAVGVLLFSVAMLLWGYHETTFAIWGHELSLPWLIPVYKVSGEILLVISIVPIAALFSESVEKWLEKFLEARPTSLFQAICQLVLWLGTAWILVLEWTKGLAAVSGNELYSYVVLCLGILWLIVLIWVFLKPAFQCVRRELRSHSHV
jgi:hypothetical protein